MDIEHLEVFATLADELHFGRTAARLGLSTSGVSKRLQDFEAGVGIRLFARTSRRVALTPEAGPLLDQARLVLASIENFRAVAADTANGTAGTVGLLHANNHFDVVSSLVRSLRSRHPDLRLEYREKPNQKIAASVLGGRAALGMCWGELPVGLDSYRFDVLLLDTVFVCSGHRLARRSAIDLDDLDGETFLLTGPDPAALWQAAGITITVRCPPIHGRDELATRIETGEGLALTASRAVPRYRHRAVVAVPLADPAAWGRLDQLLIWRTGEDSPAVRNVVETAKKLALAGAPAGDR
ncbi:MULTISPECIES: LysR family transcriptional regulator [Frankia]|uniref:LysR-family transcriptional regulator n=1 Tax=Frankia alni (strain DSM 45986 / CECT 9034 / ACN14a) TaxID=326424 RepID=Q0RIB8_FRAAA|nr:MULTISPECIES: LysR family transcriptional regulator [Frankia]CAJ62752.1 putative LysR-family transcriptional regulator [Frankia alni ACN14a]